MFLILGRITLYHRNPVDSVNIIWKINHLMSGYILLFWNSKNHWKIKVFDTAEVDVGCCLLEFHIFLFYSNTEMVQGSCVSLLSSINKGGPRLFYRGDAGISRRGAGTTMPQWQQSQTAPVCGAVRDGVKMGCLFWFRLSFNISNRLGC